MWTVLVSQGETSDSPEQVLYIEGEGPTSTEGTQGEVLDPVKYEEKPDNSPAAVRGQPDSNDGDTETSWYLKPCIKVTRSLLARISTHNTLQIKD